MTIDFMCDGEPVQVADEGRTLLEVLRDVVGVRSVKDGCSPQGQCGCCTVLVDGQARVACVTPARRVKDRTVTTLAGLTDEDRSAWADAFTECGASQCGFCTPGMIMATIDLLRVFPNPTDEQIREGLSGNLCRCTGYLNIESAVRAAAAVMNGNMPVQQSVVDQSSDRDR